MNFAGGLEVDEEVMRRDKEGTWREKLWEKTAEISDHLGSVSPVQWKLSGISEGDPSEDRMQSELAIFL